MQSRMIPLTMAFLMVTACSRSQETASFAPAEDALYITREGVITSAVIETYENEYYTEEELKASVEEALADFNGTGGTSASEEASSREAAAFHSCSVGGGTASLYIDFKDPAAYLEFMEVYPDEESSIQVKALDVTLVSDGITKGYLTGQTFKTVSSNPKEVDASEVMKHSKLYVAAIEGPALIQTEGQIQYVSSDVTVLGSTLVQTPETGMVYVIFK